MSGIENMRAFEYRIGIHMVIKNYLNIGPVFVSNRLTTWWLKEWNVERHKVISQSIYLVKCLSQRCNRQDELHNEITQFIYKVNERVT